MPRRSKNEPEPITFHADCLVSDLCADAPIQWCVWCDIIVVEKHLTKEQAVDLARALNATLGLHRCQFAMNRIANRLSSPSVSSVKSVVNS